MPLNKSTLFFRVICAIFLYHFLSFSPAIAQPIERVKQDGYSSSWLVSGYEIYVDMPCRISRTSLLPTKDCNQPYIVIKKKIAGTDTSLDSLFKPDPYSYFNLIAGEISIGTKSMFDGNDDPMKKVPISDIVIGPQESHELFALLMSAPDTPLTFKTRSGTGAPIKTRRIVLADFEARTSELIGAIHRNYDQEQTTQRRDMLLGLCLIGGVLVSVLWLFLFLLKRGQTRLQTAKQKFEMKRVARIAEDEAIREVVRGSVQKVDDSELDALRSQIKAALDVGDTETAERLLSILKKSRK
jgi:hypothetical protein